MREGREEEREGEGGGGGREEGVIFTKLLTLLLFQGESHQAAALRAYHPDEVSKQEHLKIDKTYYLQHQVHAVVSRLCEPIQGLDPAQLADCLGKARARARARACG